MTGRVNLFANTHGVTAALSCRLFNIRTACDMSRFVIEFNLASLAYKHSPDDIVMSLEHISFKT